MIEWFEEEADGGVLETSALVDDHATVAGLEGCGYRRAPDDEPHFAYLMRTLDDVPRPLLPEEFLVRHVRGEEDVEPRVAVHQAAWRPSRVTVASHRDVTTAWPYRRELDCVVQAPDSSFAAYCLAWLDEANGVGELEPVGTDPRFGCRGLAAAACAFALGQLARLGARAAIVYARGDAAYPRPKRLYESIGFRQYTSSRTFRRER